MSDTSTAESSTQDTSTDGTQQGDPADKPLGENGEKALRDERSARKAAEKAAADAQARLAELERQNETAFEKAQRELAEAREALPREVAKTFREAAVAFGGIDPEDAELLLTGSDVETLSKQAQRLLAARAVASDTTTAGPRPDLTQGGSGSLALNSDGLEDALKAKLGIA